MPPLTKYDPNHVTSSGVANLANVTTINLHGGDATCVIPFAIPSSEPNMTMIVTMTMKSSELITVLSTAAASALNLGASFPGGKTEYDCDVASLMALYASWTRSGMDVGQGYVVGPSDVYNLLAQDPWTQGQINAALTQQGGFEGISGNNGLPLIRKDYGSFLTPASETLKAKCGFADVGDPTTVPPTGGMDQVVYKKDDGYGWKLWAGIAAAGVATAILLKGVKKGRSAR